MSLLAYCKKASEGDQNFHCNKKCITCIIKIAEVKAMWKKFNISNKKINETKYARRRTHN